MYGTLTGIPFWLSVSEVVATNWEKLVDKLEQIKTGEAGTF